jgi:hypothetical protein
MNTFIKFFSGTTGALLAIASCGVCLLAAVAAACVASAGIVTAIAGTPTP